MSEWEDWKKPWSKAQCRQRYVSGDRISLRKLAEEAGLSKATMERWSARDGWDSQRAHISEIKHRKEEEKLLANVSSNISELASEHLRSYRIFHKIALAVGKAWLAQIEANPSNVLHIIKSTEINFISLVLDRAVEGERVAAALEYEDLNKAAQFLQQNGYIIIDPAAAAEGKKENTQGDKRVE